MPLRWRGSSTRRLSSSKSRGCGRSGSASSRLWIGCPGPSATTTPSGATCCSGQGRKARSSWPSTGRTRVTALGEELGHLVVASLFFFETVGIAPRDLDAACFAGYVAGLREAGWVGDERLARLGFTVDAALRSSVGLLGQIWSLVSDPALRSVVEDWFGRPLEAVVEAWAELWPFQFELADEARVLLATVG